MSSLATALLGAGSAHGEAASPAFFDFPLKILQFLPKRHSESFVLGLLRARALRWQYFPDHVVFSSLPRTKVVKISTLFWLASFLRFHKPLIRSLAPDAVEMLLLGFPVWTYPNPPRLGPRPFGSCPSILSTHESSMRSSSFSLVVPP